MTFMKFPLVATMTAVVALAACTNPNGTIGASSDDDFQRTKNGALIGAGAGALIGALANDGNRSKGAITGALAGGFVGGGIGAVLDKQERDLRQSLGNDNVTITNTGDRLIVTLPQDILFAVNSSAVRPDLQRDLGTVASNLQAYPDSTVQVIGHTDSDGEAGFNQQLSESRANAVASVLLNNGVPSQRVQAFGRGEAQPVASNLSVEGKAQNRRVEIVILPNAA